MRIIINKCNVLVNITYSTNYLISMINRLDLATVETIILGWIRNYVYLGFFRIHFESNTFLRVSAYTQEANGSITDLYNTLMKKHQPPFVDSTRVASSREVDYHHTFWYCYFLQQLIYRDTAGFSRGWILTLCLFGLQGWLPIPINE